MVCAEHSESHSALVRNEELRVARQAKQRPGANCEKSVWQSWELSPNLPAQGLCPTHQLRRQATGSFHLLLCSLPISLFPLQVITPVWCTQSLLKIQEGNNHESLWMFSNQTPEGKQCLWLNLHYSIKRKCTKSLLNEETVWVRTTFTKFITWNAAAEGWAMA